MLAGEAHFAVVGEACDGFEDRFRVEVAFYDHFGFEAAG
jgi:hypothetical protein